MAALFATYLPSLAGKSLSVDHRVLKHRAGKRCVFAYDIATADGTTVLVGKIYRKKRGKRTFGRMQHMLSAASLSGKKLQMAEPLAYLPEIDMLLLPMLSGKTLEQISEIETIGNAMQSLGQTLAVLHSLSLPNCEIRTMREHLAKYCHPGFDALCSAHPSLQKTVNEILQRLLDFDEIDQMLKPVHGDINLSQIFVENGSITLIDFDSSAVANPALDIGNMFAVLETHFPENFEFFQAQLQQGYRQNGGIALPSQIRLYYGFAFLRRTMIAFRNSAAIAELANLLEKSRGLCRLTGFTPAIND